MSKLVSLDELLPAIYRIRDAERGEPLRALLRVIEGELRVVEEDIAALYDNLFIETCDEWVVPYIGDLLGVRGLYAVRPSSFSSRAYVANTLAYRRRKGTAAVLEQLARDTTGWTARAIEFFQRLITTQHVNHVRLHCRATPDLRSMNALELLGGPFEQAQHCLDVRRIASGRGRYNIPNVGLFVWRLQTYPLERVTPRAAGGPAGRRFHVSPLGLDTPLFNRPQSEPEIAHLAEEPNVPGRLRRRALYEDRATLASPEAPARSFYLLGEHPVLRVFFDGAQLQPEQILACNLEGWDEPGWSAPTSSLVEATGRSTQVAIDPDLGRLALLSGVTAPARIEVSFNYGFSADLGGGPYDRRQAADAALQGREITWQAAVSPSIAAVGDEPIFATMQAAVASWNAQPAPKVGVITIADSATYEENLTGANAIEIPAQSLLLIIAADWPVVTDPAIGDQARRVVGQLTPAGRPHQRGNISVRGTGDLNPGGLMINGLLLEGNLTCLSGSLGQLRVEHCTIVPGEGALRVTAANTSLGITIERSICGPIELPESVPALRIVDSIISSGAESDPGLHAIRSPGAPAKVQRATIFGTVEARSLEADNSVFSGRVRVERAQAGCVRFSFVPPGSRTPRRYRCQPDLALEERTDEEQQIILESLRPEFTSREYSHPGYAQLGLACPAEIATGAEDGSEMGAFSSLQQPQRLANLYAALDEYLPFGLEAGIIFVT